MRDCSTSTTATERPWWRWSGARSSALLATRVGRVHPTPTAPTSPSWWKTPGSVVDRVAAHGLPHRGGPRSRRHPVLRDRAARQRSHSEVHGGALPGQQVELGGGPCAHQVPSRRARGVIREGKLDDQDRPSTTAEPLSSCVGREPDVQCRSAAALLPGASAVERPFRSNPCPIRLACAVVRSVSRSRDIDDT